MSGVQSPPSLEEAPGRSSKYTKFFLTTNAENVSLQLLRTSPVTARLSCSLGRKWVLISVHAKKKSDYKVVSDRIKERVTQEDCGRGHRSI